MSDEFDRARLRALRLIGVKARSVAGLLARLVEDGFSRDAAQSAVFAMEDAGYVDDVKMADDYVAYAAESKGHGRHRIVNDLAQRGVDISVAEAAYARYVNDRGVDVDLGNAQAALKKRMDQLGLDVHEIERDDMRRLSGYLVRRGFSFDTIRQAFECIYNEA